MYNDTDDDNRPTLAECEADEAQEAEEAAWREAEIARDVREEHDLETGGHGW